MGVILKKHLRKQSEAFKQANSDISLCHVHNRAADSVEYLEFVKNELGDDAVVQVKKSRNSNQTKINPNTNRKVHIKLIDSKFANQKVYLIKKMTFIMICDLGGGKGKTTRYYFLRGLKKRMIADSANQFREQHNISDALYSEMQLFAGILTE